MTSIKERTALLQAQSGAGGIPMPQIPGGQRLSISRNDSTSSGNQTPSSHSLAQQLSSGSFSHGPGGAADEVPAEEQDAPPQHQEADDVFDSSGLTHNVALDRPMLPMQSGRRRPSTDRRVSASIPDDHKVALADILEASKGPSVERLDALEKAFNERLVHLEEEVKLLRAALAKAGFAVPEPAPSASSPQPLKKKPIAVATSPRSPPAAPPPPPPPLPLLATSPREPSFKQPPTTASSPREPSFKQQPPPPPPKSDSSARRLSIPPRPGSIRTVAVAAEPEVATKPVVVAVAAEPEVATKPVAVVSGMPVIPAAAFDAALADEAANPVVDAPPLQEKQAHPPEDEEMDII